MYQYNAKILNVVDGDTFDMDIDLGFHIHIHERIRLLEIDTPETTAKVSEEDKAAGIAVRDWARYFLTDQECVIESKGTDSFGRWLAHLTLNYNEMNIVDMYNQMGINKKNENYSIENCKKTTEYILNDMKDKYINGENIYDEYSTLPN